MIKQRRAAIAFLAAAPGAQAHGFGQRYDLPLPFELYASGAALVIVISCVMLALYVRAAPKAGDYPHVDLLRTRVGRTLASPAAIMALRGLAVVPYLFILLAGFVGDPGPFRNIVPVAVWALWWVGLAYVSAFVGDLWKLANPLETIFAALERAYRRLAGRELSRHLPAPGPMQAWPAVGLYLLFIWLEIGWEGSDSPPGIATAILFYSLLTWIGMGLFGREEWLRRGEVFSWIFGILARFAPMHFELRDRRVSEWHLRPYAVGLLPREPANGSVIALVLVMLSAVSFDGFLETPAWASIAEALAPDDAARARTLGVVIAPLLFAAVYLVFCRLVAWNAAALHATRRIAGLFVLTLVPIAIAYQVAHYLSFLLQAGQYIIPLASDPFGWKWNLFGTASYFVRPVIVESRIVWIVSLAAIVVGHVAALYLGHVLSLREFPDRRAAVRSQAPMLVLMVAYTMSSLWIIAQPIVTSR